jgi:hypothetical protein|tara:strand:- start:251 stop:643 length:393 start_codon:yes stop_codon:yes gene_type:complete
MFKNLFIIIKYIVIGILGIAVWWYLIFYALPDWSVYKRLKSQMVSTYCNIRPNSETCINIKKRKKDTLEVKNYCDKLFPIDDYEKSGPFGEKNFKCYCENMNQRGHNIKDGNCSTLEEFIKELKKEKGNN